VVTGGTLVDGKVIRPDEVRGKKMDGGVPHVIQKGDTLHIDPNVPHQTIHYCICGLVRTGKLSARPVTRRARKVRRV
jgi:hypothetical protein